MRKIVLLAAAASAVLLCAAAPACADEFFIGGFAHDVKQGFSGSPHEDDTGDVELGYRTKRFDNLWWLAKPYFYGKAEINLGGRTNFYTAGIELRKHLFSTGLYGGFGLGLTYADGYRTYPDPTAPGLTAAQQASDREIIKNFKALGSDVVFNPNFSVGYEFSRRLSFEAAWDHYSHAGLLGKRNPGIDNYGARLVYKFGPRN